MPRLTQVLRMARPLVNANAAALHAMQRRVFSGSVLLFTAVCGLRLAVDVYSGPRIGLGLGIAAFIAIALWQALQRLPETAGRVLCYVCGLLL